MRSGPTRLQVSSADLGVEGQPKHNTALSLLHARDAAAEYPCSPAITPARVPDISVPGNSSRPTVVMCVCPQLPQHWLQRTTRAQQQRGGAAPRASCTAADDPPMA